MVADFGWKMHGEVWGHANAALGIINRNDLGKTRHLETGLLWIQPVAAEQMLKFGKVRSANNPADLFTKHLDERTSLHHTTKLGFQAIGGRPLDAPNLHNINLSIDAHVNGNDCIEWPWLCYLQIAKGRNKRTGVNGNRNDNLNVVSAETNATDARQQMLWGSKWGAMPHHPRGSTLTFQLNAGVPCGTNLRPGVTMHRGGDI